MNFPSRRTDLNWKPSAPARKPPGSGNFRTEERITSARVKTRPTSSGRRSRTIVSTSGSSGKARSARSSLQRSQIPPVGTNLDVHHQGNRQLNGPSHSDSRQLSDFAGRRRRSLEDQLVMNLKEHLRRDPRGSQRLRGA